MTLEPDPDKKICPGDTSFLLTDVGVRGEFLYEYALILTCLCNICSWSEPGGEMFVWFLCWDMAPFMIAYRLHSGQ